MISERQLNALLEKAPIKLRLHGVEDEWKDIHSCAALREFIDIEIGAADYDPSFQRLLRDASNTLQRVLEISDTPSDAKRALDAAASSLDSQTRGNIYVGTPAGKFLSSMDGITREGAWHAITEAIQPSRFNNVWYLLGVIRGINYKRAIFEDGTTPVDSERQAFITLRSEIDGYKSDSAKDFADVKSSHLEWRKTSDKEYSDWLSATKEKANVAEKLLNDTHRANLDRSKELEEIYTEKLALEGPVRNWGKLEASYKNSGRWWVSAAVVTTAVLLFCVGFLVYAPPYWMDSTEINLEGVRGMIVLGLGISLVIYLIHLFVRMATSSYHLARDARERRQLTLAFLGLTRRKAIGDEERKIVLAAVFSRAETGLVKHDAGPQASFNTLLANLKGPEHR